MGIKRRIISSPRKFGRKHRTFLDKLDGTRDGVVSDLETYIRSITVVDRGNQTVILSASLDGNYNTAQDSVKYYIDSFGVSSDAMNIADGATGDSSALATSSVPAITGSRSAPSGGGILSAGQHDVEVRFIDNGATGSAKLHRLTKRFTVAESKVVLHSGSSTTNPVMSGISTLLSGSNNTWRISFGEFDTDMTAAGQGPGDDLDGWAAGTSGYNLIVTSSGYLSQSLSLTSLSHEVSASAGAGTYTFTWQPIGSASAGFITSSVLSGQIVLS